MQETDRTRMPPGAPQDKGTVNLFYPDRAVGTESWFIWSRLFKVVTYWITIPSAKPEAC